MVGARRLELLLPLLLLSSCLPKVRVSDEEAPNPAAASCLSAQDCPATQTCCPLGLVGSCRTLEGSGCPQPDLALSIPDAFLMRIEERVFSADSIADRCALEKRCIGALGARRLLRFAIRIENQGSGDLILGAPEVTPGFTRAECDGRSYLANYLHYELLVPETRHVTTDGWMQAPCREAAPGFATRFDCGLLGLWRGFSETIAARGTDCQWIDITAVPPGAYLLRATVNPERRWQEPTHDNDSLERAIVLPSGDPLAPCPRPYDGLSGLSTARDCGWSVAAFAAEADAGASAALGARCTPEEPVRVICGACAGNPMLRVCEGSNVCTLKDALGTGFVDSHDLFGDQPCASVDFTCPASGSYTTLVAHREAEPLTIPDEGGFLATLACQLERSP